MQVSCLHRCFGSECSLSMIKPREFAIYYLLVHNSTSFDVKKEWETLKVVMLMRLRYILLLTSGVEIGFAVETKQVVHNEY